MAEFALRPLPIGALPLPFGYLLIPDRPDTAAVRVQLLAGRTPTDWPASLRAHQLAFAGDADGALAVLIAAEDDPICRFNRFVLDPDSVDVVALRAELAGTELAGLLDLVGFGMGRRDAPPEPASLTGELTALALAAHAALAADAGRTGDALTMLEEAIGQARQRYPALAGVLYGAAGQLHRQAGDLPAAMVALRAGVKILAATDLDIGCAELHLELAGTLHELAGERRDLLSQAVNHYHSALQLVTVEQAPELFASAHANLGTAYLTMPMVEASDQLRLGVAVASLRAALTVYTIENYPRQWASAQLNLANALVYAPSTHQADNLVEAVELYEAVLGTRNRTDDPLGFARVLANQGNALAHLGMFEHARGKLVEARFIFEEFHEYDATSSVRGILDEIARMTVLSGAEL